MKEINFQGKLIANKVTTIDIICKVLEIKAPHHFSYLLFSVTNFYNRNGRLRIHSAIARPGLLRQSFADSGISAAMQQQIDPSIIPRHRPHPMHNMDESD